MSNFVDGNCFWLLQLSILIKRILLKKEADVVGTLIEVLCCGLCLQNIGT